ncbi:MAG: IMP cyclohydrolase [Solobacterium sp.]|nr:IMP cyclohydrolase [Solobacterium sp.]
MNIYEINDLGEKLSTNPYPGRGIILGMTPDGRHSAAAYFIMGRSVNSRNRIFAEEPDGIRTEAFDASKVSDPSLIIYHPVRRTGGRLIVTNGNQTDTIRDYIEEGKGFSDALRTREFEPDGPNWTPRISGMIEKDGSYQLSILKSIDEEGSACARQTFEYPGTPGLGHFIHTYVTDGNPIPSFTGEPERVAVPDDMDAFTEMIWNCLNEDNKISLYVCWTDLTDGTFKETILNKNK